MLLVFKIGFNVFRKIITEYDKVNIFNCDETALFFKAMPNKSLTVKKKNAKEVKNQKTCYPFVLCEFSG
jgi:hypothetical protein